MSVKLFACGDVVNFKAKQDFVDNKLIKIIQNSDIAICNFEAPILHQDMKPIKKAGPYVFQSKKSVQYLKDVGFNMASLANNHIYDYGQKGLVETIKELEKNNIDFIGAGITFEEAYKPKIIEKNGIKIGFLAGCENQFGCLYEKKERGGYAWLFHSLLDDNVIKLKSQCDFVILIAHAGVEDIEIPIKEWRDRYKRLCDLGVDVIIGHHPHVPQGYERYGNSLIFYSLGNFYFDTCGFQNKSDDSYSVILSLSKNMEIDYQIIYHKKIDGKVCLTDENHVNFSLNDLCDILINEYEYIKQNNELSVKLFNNYYYKYYELSLGIYPISRKILNNVKSVAKYLVNLPNKDKENRALLLLHNIRIDSHRFVVQRALSLMYEETP
ncbi:CapA family protein [Thermodesulfovibrio hydrogeniphilus]